MVNGVCLPLDKTLSGANRWKLPRGGEDGSRPPFGFFCTYLLFAPLDPSAPLDLVLIPLPSALWASWKAGPGARDGYLLRLSGQVEKNSTRGPGALNATFPGPLPAGHYVLELRALAGPYSTWARASAWLHGESGLVGNRLGSCPGAPVRSSWVLTPQKQHPLQSLLPSPDRATGPNYSWIGWWPLGSPGGRHSSMMREPQASWETPLCHLPPPGARPRASQTIPVSASYCVP